MEDITERGKTSQERTFEHKVVELEQSAFRLLALIKELHGNFLREQGRRSMLSWQQFG